MTGAGEAIPQHEPPLSADAPASADALSPEPAGPADAAASGAVPPSGPDGQDTAGAVLAGISADIQRLLVASERYHARAEQREGVIDHLRAEVERLRRGERRGLLRPLLAEMCRLRDDLLRQAEDLPGEFDAERARLLLRSYADSVMVALEDNGVVAFTPADGEPFNPRMHRRVGGEQAGNPGQAGRIARVRRSGYLDVETVNPIALAEVTLSLPGGVPGELPAAQQGPDAEDPATPRPPAATEEKERP